MNNKKPISTYLYHIYIHFTNSDFFFTWQILKIRFYLPFLWKQKGEEIGVTEDVFKDDIANDSIEWKLTLGLYVDWGVLVTSIWHTLGDVLEIR